MIGRLTTAKQLCFNFCGGCGSYIQPEQGKGVIRGGLPVVLCTDCQDRKKQDTGDIVSAFEKKYNL